MHNYAEEAEADVVFGPQTVHYSDRDLVLHSLEFEGLFRMPSLIILTNRTCLTVFKRSPLGSRLVCLLIGVKTSAVKFTLEQTTRAQRGVKV